MRSIDKLVIFVYILALTALIGVISIIPFGLISYESAKEIFDSAFGTYRWFYFAAGVLLILLHIRIIAGLLTGDRTKKFGIVKYTSEGEYNISFDTIKSLVLKTTSEIRGIRDVNVMVKPGKDNINIFIKALILPDTNIPQTVKEVQETVGNYVRAITDIAVGEVKVVVTDVASSTKLRVE